MYHDRPRRSLVRVDSFLCRPIFEIETFRKLEVELNCRALERSMEGIANGDVHLGTIERPVTRVEIPFARIMPLERLCELL
jgi:hypothetical protein